MTLGRGSMERDARSLAGLVNTIWHRLTDGAYFGWPDGPNIEVRDIPDYNPDGTILEDAGGEHQMRFGLFVRGASGRVGVTLLTGTATAPDGPVATFGSDTDHTHFDDTGHMTMTGDARPWRDQLTDSLNLKISGTGISTDAAEGLVNFDYNALYDSDYLYCNVQLNHDRDLTAQLYPHLHWFQAKNYAPNFLLEYRWQINGGAKVTAWTKLKCNTLAHTYSSGTLHQISYSAAIAVPVGSAISDIVQFRIYRDTSNASGEFAGACPYNTGGNASAGMLAFDIHFQINSLGSTDEYVK